MKVMRIGIFEIAAIGALVFVLFLPGPTSTANSIYPPDDPAQLEIAQLQGTIYNDPGDGNAAGLLAYKLTNLGQSDLGIHAAVSAAKRKSPTEWRALMALASMYEVRQEYKVAIDFARQSLKSCIHKNSRCGVHEQAYIQLLNRKIEDRMAGNKNTLAPVQ